MRKVIVFKKKKKTIPDYFLFFYRSCLKTPYLAAK